MDHKLIIYHWNANGILGKLTELKHFLKNNNVQIMAINETKINKSHKRNYRIIRKDRDSHGGGIAILIRNDITHMDSPDNRLSHLELIQIQICNDIVLTAWYNPPNQVIKPQDLDIILHDPRKHIIVGGLNAKSMLWNCPNSNQNGRILENYINNNNACILYPDQPTHFPSNGQQPSTLDLAITKNITCDIDILNDLNSDHLPIKLTLGSYKSSISFVSRWDYNHANWANFRRVLNEITILLTSIRYINKTARNRSAAFNRAHPIHYENLNQTKTST